MKTFCQIDKTPVAGVVCVNPTSMRRSIVMKVGNRTNWDGVDEKVCIILNERNNTQAIEYDWFCQRYYYQGESREDISTFFVTKEDFKKGNHAPKRRDLYKNLRSHAHAVVMEVFTNKKKEKKVKFVNESGITSTVDYKAFKRNYEWNGRSACNLKKILEVKWPIEKVIFDFLKGLFKKKSG